MIKSEELKIMNHKNRLISGVIALVAILSMILTACAAPTATTAPAATQATGSNAAAANTPATAASGGSGEMTDVGTPRSDTLIVQTFDGKTDNPDNMNPLSGSYSLWRG